MKYTSTALYACISSNNFRDFVVKIEMLFETSGVKMWNNFLRGVQI